MSVDVQSMVGSTDVGEEMRKDEIEEEFRF